MTRWHGKDRPAVEGDATFADKSWEEELARVRKENRHLGTPTTYGNMNAFQAKQPYRGTVGGDPRGERGSFRTGLGHVFPSRHMTNDELYFTKTNRLYSGHAKLPVDNWAI